MTMHLTSRLAWHDDGWNGRICKQPECNTYCVGTLSYPGDVVSRYRDLERERKNAGNPIKDLEGENLPPCIYSANAFSPDAIRGYSNPPHFFFDGARRVEWDIPPYTVCAWPYKEMYNEGVQGDGRFVDNDKRSENVDAFFSNIENDRSLIFYYANYSNPFSESEDRRYALIGVSRVREVGSRLVYEDVSEKIAERYAGGMVWARNVSSHYPDQGLRLPYHRYRDDPEKLMRFAVFPENPRTCKYASLLLENDDAIGLLEQFLSAVSELRSMGDDSEDWEERKRWISRCIAELWNGRGLYPGLLNVMGFLGAEKAISPARSLMEDGESNLAYRLFFDAVDNKADAPQINLTGDALKSLSRQWQLKNPSAQKLLRDVLPRLSLDVAQIGHVLNEPEAHGLSDADALIENPYALCENYVGNSPDDTIPWSTVDRGVLPSPELGGSPLAGMETDDARRLRALCVEEIRREPNQTFRASGDVLDEVNARLKKLPKWKSAAFNDRYFEVDREVLEQSLELRRENKRLWLYLKPVYDDERAIEKELVRLSGRPDIELNRPFASEDWSDCLLKNQSPLFRKARDEYEDAVRTQIKECEAIFRKPVSIITGSAGTGKTSVICAIIQAVRKTEGDGAALTVLAPTGKASDRIRAKISEWGIAGVDTSTVHSLLAKNGWLNDNLTFKRTGGRQSGSGTVIIDEASMLDLGLMACFVRAIDWRQVRRLIFVGDPHQLPPIGRGRVFADMIRWLDSKQHNSVARLSRNLRLLENEAEGKGTAILNLANLFINDLDGDQFASAAAEDEVDKSTTDVAETLLSDKVHKGGTVDSDLDVLYWDNPEDLPDLLIKTIEKEMSGHTGKSLDSDKPYDLWRAAFNWEPERYQVLTPHRGEIHGVEAINSAVQERIASKLKRQPGTLDGITLFDKVIQYRNRPKSNPIRAYNYETGKPERIEVFNGEIGFVEGHNFDKRRVWRLKRFQVKFERKGNYAVGYGRGLSAGNASESVEENLELAYALSVHKAQGSEFNYTYVIIPRSGNRPLSSELLYTALTRAQQHCTIFIQGDVSTLLSARRRENSQIGLVNSSLFKFREIPGELINRQGWYEEGKIHQDLSGNMVRSKSELIVANLLHGRGVPFVYEVLLRAPDGTSYLPDFTITWQGEKWYWEHWGVKGSDAYDKHREKKVAWYNRHFPNRLIETFDEEQLSQKAAALIEDKFSG